MALATAWRFKVAAGVVSAALILTGCGDDDNDGPDLPETETETEIPGVDAPEVEVDE